ncbi:DUF6778 family protein [Pseudoruegeria sp. HB172150]|uniref:DUF6778 family protein n=1 Tax=Pseudoruegeria sp. HB172150 TaxID=2721164 RepID=UPI00155536EF|nr:DUF6778 family protein [Pseudoruegeria sp. HB172150]
MTTYRRRIILALGAVLGLAACGSNPVTRDFTPATALETAQVLPGGLHDFSVARIDVTVPDSLRESESNAYYPGTDIVWHGDPMGNRHEQVKAIFTDAMAKGVKPFDGARDVVLDIEVTRFHALTQKARYTVGGVHSIHFYLQVADAATGEVIVPKHFVKANLRAYGGSAAVAAEARGDTQKVRISRHLAGVIQDELAAL